MSQDLTRVPFWDSSKWPLIRGWLSIGAALTMVEELVTDVVLFACVIGVVMLGLGVNIGMVIVWLRRRWRHS